MKLPTLMLSSSDQRLQGKRPSFLLKIAVANTSHQGLFLCWASSCLLRQVGFVMTVERHFDRLKTEDRAHTTREDELSPRDYQSYNAHSQAWPESRFTRPSQETDECVPLQCSLQIWKVKSLNVFEFHCLSLLLKVNSPFQDSSLKMCLIYDTCSFTTSLKITIYYLINVSNSPVFLKLKKKNYCCHFKSAQWKLTLALKFYSQNILSPVFFHYNQHNKTCI